MSKIDPRFDTVLPPVVHDATIPRVNSLALRVRGSLAKAAGHVFHALRPDWRATIPAESPPETPEPAEEGGTPRIVWQTNFTDRCTWPVWRNVRHNRAMAKAFSFRFWNDAACDAYMREHAGERTAAAYARLTNGAAKADLWRLQVLHDFGGVYLDMDGTLVAPLAPLLRGRRELLGAEYCGLPEAESYEVTELWSGDTYDTPDEISAMMPAHGVKVYRIKAKEIAE